MARPPTILIIDDERTILTLISTLLKKEGYETIVAESGQEAFALISKRIQELGSAQLQLIICDWQMPGLNGVQILNEVHQSPFKETPFILMSGALTREELLVAAKNKANGVLIKPLDKQVLLQKIKDLLQSQA
jgi:CheY-like chemotaxis protein